MAINFYHLLSLLNIILVIKFSWRSVPAHKAVRLPQVCSHPSLTHSNSTYTNEKVEEGLKLFIIHVQQLLWWKCHECKKLMWYLRYSADCLTGRFNLLSLLAPYLISSFILP